MTAAIRKELLGVLEELCRRYPHWRFGQLVSNLCGWADAEVWDAEDGQLLEAAKKHLESQSHSPVEIGNPSDKGLGPSSPPSSAEQADAYARIADLFDLEEADRVAATERHGYTIEEVMQYLHSLEKKE